MEPVKAHPFARGVSFGDTHRLVTRLVGYLAKGGEVESILQLECCSPQVGLRLHLFLLLSLSLLRVWARAGYSVAVVKVFAGTKYSLDTLVCDGKTIKNRFESHTYPNSSLQVFSD